MNIYSIAGLASLLLLGACATVDAPSGVAVNTSPFMPAGVAVDPPQGYVDMCQRSPELCANPAEAAASKEDAVSAEPEHPLFADAVLRDADPAATIQFASAQGSSTVADFNASPAVYLSTGNRAFNRDNFADVAGPDFASDRSARVASRAATSDSPSAPQSDPMTLLNQVNRRVNAGVHQVSDQQVYGGGDHWHRSGVGRGAVGDCKDLAIEKRMELIEAGFPADEMFYAIAFRADIGFHAVLIAHTASGDMVLDSRTPYVVSWGEAPYIWVKRQMRGDPASWSLVGGPPAGYADLRTHAADQDAIHVAFNSTTSMSQGMQ